MQVQRKVSKELFDRIVQESHYVASYGDVSTSEESDHSITQEELESLRSELGWTILMGARDCAPTYGAHMVFQPRDGRPYMRFDVDGDVVIEISSLIPNTASYKTVRIPTVRTRHSEYQLHQYVAKESIREELKKVLDLVGIHIS